MAKITLVSHGETITFEQAHSQADEWRVRSSNGNGKTGLTTQQVKEQVANLEEKGFEKL